MEIIDYNRVIDFSENITLKALDKGLIKCDLSNPKETAKNIAHFFDLVSNELSNITS